MVGMLAVSILIPLVIGFLLIALLWPLRVPSRPQMLLRVFLSFCIGQGIISIVYFLGLIFFGRPDQRIIFVEILLLIGLLGSFLYRRNKYGVAAGLEGAAQCVRESPLNRILSLGFFIALAASLFAMIVAAMRGPHGGWDAWAVWNLHARAIYRGGTAWKNIFSPLISWSHPDYPLLLPLSVARGWQYAGIETTMVPAVFSLLFSFATVGLLYASLSTLRSKEQGFLAGVILLGSTSFLMYGSSQLADIPFSLYLLAAIVLIVLQNSVSSVSNYNLLILAGMTIGFASWTKNEGLAAVVVVCLAHLVGTTWFRGWKHYLHQALFFFAGLVPILAVIFYFKTQISPPSDLLAAQLQKSTLTLSTDYTRHLLISETVGKHLFNYSGYGINITYLLAIYLICIGIAHKHKIALVTSSLVVFLMFVVFYLVYLTTPYDLAWHLRTSLDRVLLQLWPSFLFIYFLLALTPQESLQREKSAHM
jgi:hypothetical protein